MTRFSPIGFIVGLVCAILLVSVGPKVLSFNHARRVFGLVALLLWGWLAFNFRPHWP